MKKILIILALLALAACSASPDEKTQIENYAKQIDPKSNVYAKCEDTILGLTTEGTHVISYYHDGNLVKLEVAYYGETGKTEEEIYLKDNTVVFIKAIETEYSVPIYDEYFDAESSSQIMHKHYFKDQKMISWFNDGISIESSSKEFTDREADFNVVLEDLSLEKLIARKGCNPKD